MKPTIGRIVHFQPYDHFDGTTAQPTAAIITAVHSNEDIALTVVNPTGFDFKLDVPHSETPKPGHWNWPPREPAPAPDKRESGAISVTLSQGYSPNLDGIVGSALAQMDARRYLK